MIFFWTLWGIDAIITIVVVYFFFVGLGDGSVSSFNMPLWLLILAVIMAIMLGSLKLMQLHYLGMANVILAIPALPGVLYGLMLCLMMGIKDWK